MIFLTIRTKSSICINNDSSYPLLCQNVSSTPNFRKRTFTNSIPNQVPSDFLLRMSWRLRARPLGTRLRYWSCPCRWPLLLPLIHAGSFTGGFYYSLWCFSSGNGQQEMNWMYQNNYVSGIHVVKHPTGELLTTNRR